LTIYLVRHAKAGERRTWSDNDRLRPISRSGQRQARGLVGLLETAHFERILSSPYVRCIESMAPLACARGLAIEPTEALAEEAALGPALALVTKHAQSGAVLCSHGDVIPMLLEHFARRGLDLGPDPTCPKGCTWVLDVNDAGDVTSVRYIAPAGE
jgi:broad specificity phosphatase PhoE